MDDIEASSEVMPARYWCPCGRGFYSRTGQEFHSASCDFEHARAVAFMAAVRTDRDPFEDPVVAAQMPRLPVGVLPQSPPAAFRRVSGMRCNALARLDVLRVRWRGLDAFGGERAGSTSFRARSDLMGWVEGCWRAGWRSLSAISGGAEIAGIGDRWDDVDRCMKRIYWGDI